MPESTNDLRPVEEWVRAKMTPAWLAAGILAHWPQGKMVSEAEYVEMEGRVYNTPSATNRGGA